MLANNSKKFSQKIDMAHFVRAKVGEFNGLVKNSYSMKSKKSEKKTQSRLFGSIEEKKDIM